MGVKNASELYTIYKKYYPFNRINLSHYSGGYIVIDALSLIYKYADSQPDAKVKELFACLKGAMMCMINEIIPIFVFDGSVPAIKKVSLEKRKNEKKNAPVRDELNSNTKQHKNMPKQSYNINYDNVQNAIFMLSLMGVPVVVAYQEADAQCVVIEQYLKKMNKHAAVLSNDFDIFLFGCSTMLRLSTLFENHVDEYSTANFFQALNLHINQQMSSNILIQRDQFIDLCVLGGTDYCDEVQYKLCEAIPLYFNNNMQLTKCALNQLTKNKLLCAKNEYVETSIIVPDTKMFELKKPNSLLLKNMMLSNLFCVPVVDALVKFLENFYKMSSDQAFVNPNSDFESFRSYRHKYFKKKYDLSVDQTLLDFVTK